MRVAPMCVADFLNEQFQTPLLVEGLAAPAVIATWAAPWSAGTNTNLILRKPPPAAKSSAARRASSPLSRRPRAPAAPRSG
jgi:hypothetical protein